jgi:predicted nucleotide-binding protein
MSDLQSALPKLQRRINEINSIDPTQATRTYTPEFSAVVDNTNATLVEIFGPNSIEYERYKVLSIYAGRNSYSREISRDEMIAGYMEGKKRALIKIDTAIKFINEKLADAETIVDKSSNREEWLSAADALALLGMSHHLGARTICKRAHAGLIKARAARFNRDGRSADNVDVPDEFWWAEGERALHQNWATGDFDTWINHEIHLEAFGVTFRRSDIERLNPVTTGDKGQKMRAAEQKVFIGHGHSLVWLELKSFLQDDLDLTIDEFNRVSTAGIATSNRLEQMLDDAAFAFLILTAEDEATDGKLHARENVVHEAGLFQGRLGFKKAILLLEETCEKFSNIDGLGYIPFPTGKMRAAFEDIRKVLKREGLIASEEKSGGGSLSASA